MVSRRVVIDMSVPRVAVADACAVCGASFDWVGTKDLREVSFAWRGRPGQHPGTFVLRCRNCKRLAVVYKTSGGQLAFVPDQDEALRCVRERGRDDAAALAGFDDSDRDR